MWLSTFDKFFVNIGIDDVNTGKRFGLLENGVCCTYSRLFLVQCRLR